ncbi:hypothetical protein [Ornithinimicrobium sp. W1665]|uniref:hypothetical protein n=1 Tax=Ornithinimicrobium sp. W1665 TaxID=3416666 RepID=UPI003D69FFA8
MTNPKSTRYGRFPNWRRPIPAVARALSMWSRDEREGRDLPASHEVLRTFRGVPPGVDVVDEHDNLIHLMPL